MPFLADVEPVFSETSLPVTLPSLNSGVFIFISGCIYSSCVMPFLADVEPIFSETSPSPDVLSTPIASPMINHTAAVSTIYVYPSLLR
jgi:hypothetical protein